MVRLETSREVQAEATAASAPLLAAGSWVAATGSAGFGR